MKMCDLDAGTVLPIAGGGRGYAIAGSGSLTGARTYQVFLNAFSSQCGGNESGYISVPQTALFGTTTWLVPIIEIIGPG